ncbi:MAG: uracil-DNA glycosylase [Candidatus Spechtbacteria bacterium RIFCSPLOWO2_01_FULL_46_10]|uniref:Type-4 uracil-DNA glycosylase n=1 Tax=Candidatus Spechtbacteria bacterium RIFCSPLOWO2_01_FULL_46_10 TaxID=1802163 RepID=A0A1G2HE01_9BACT|nr:MAG: uracil-DNA glycosylase [Candidatus Spechtbacteria bacterium RIFCSPLOWO2_01_FULL_46_10]
MADKTKTELLREIRDEIARSRTLPLAAYRRKYKYYPVIGEGSHGAKIMFVGEAPGVQEAKTGRPFCGAAGRVLDELLAGVKIARHDIYITNIVKDRPPGNRDPEPKEIAAYAPYLLRQIEIIKPQIIVTLGRFSTAFIMREFGLSDKLAPIGKIHGNVYNAKTSCGRIMIMPMYHPAAALYAATTKKLMEEDFKKIK